MEQVLERARPAFEVLIIDGSGDLMNPVSTVGLSQSSQVLVVHNPSAASGLWFRSMSDFIRQLHLGDKLTHITRETVWGLPSREYGSGLGIEMEVLFSELPQARQLEESGTPIYWESEKTCRRYKKQMDCLIQILQQKEATS